MNNASQPPRLLQSKPFAAIVAVLALLVTLLVPVSAANADPEFAEIGGTVLGELEGGGTAPVQGVTVTLYDDTGFFDAQSTAADGSYFFGSLPPGSYTLQANIFGPTYAPQFWQEKSTLASADYFWVALGEVADKDFVLERKATLSGTVVDEDQDGLQNISALVWILRDGTYQLAHLQATNASGGFSIPGLIPGAYKVGFTDYLTGNALDGTGGVNFHDEFYDDQHNLTNATVLLVGSGDAVALDDAELAPVLPLVTGTKPTIDGVPQNEVGDLNAIEGAWGPGDVAFTYQWFADGAPIAGATTSNFPLFDETLVGTLITVAVTGSADDHDPLTLTSDPIGPIAGIFGDVPSSHPFVQYIEWMRLESISNGYIEVNGVRTYHPIEDVSRKAMAAFLFRLSHDTYTPPATATFADVPTSHPFFKEIEWMKAEGITNGNVGPGGTLVFLPDDPISRQAMAAFLYRMDGSPAYTPPATATFTDVAVGAPFFKEVEWMKAQGITNGNVGPGGTLIYLPIDPVSRQAMAAFLYRFAHRLPGTG